MAPSFRDYLDKLRLASSIVEVAGQYVPLKRTGSRYKGLCPFHQEKTPSFIVSPDRETFHCFGCGVGGDVIEFVRRIENLEWIEAVEVLARRHGMEAPPREGSRQTDEQRRERESLFALHDLAAEFYAGLLRHPDKGNAARAYLAERGIPDEAVQRFRLGVAPEGWDNLLRAAKAKGFSENALVSAGLAIRNEERGRCYDRFRDRIIFPICDAMGRVIAFGGRLYQSEEGPESGAKYINSPETALFKKNQTLYALHRARDAIRGGGTAVVLEGYTDVIALHMAGFDHAVATLGTALTEMHARLLRRFAREVVLLYDDDEAGRTAMERGVETLAGQEISIRCVSLGEGEDPDSYIRRYGGDAMAQRLKSAKPFFEHFLIVARKSFDFNVAEERSAAVERLAPIVQAVKDPVLAEECLRQLAEAVRAMPDALRRRLRPRRAAGRRETESVTDNVGDLAVSMGDRLHQAEVATLRILIEYPQAFEDIGGFELEWIEDRRIRAWVERILALPTDQRTDVWRALQEMESPEDEQAMLRGLVLVDEIVSPSALPQTVARLKLRWQQRQARRISASLGGAGAKELDDETRRKLGEAHQLASENLRTAQEIRAGASPST